MISYQLALSVQVFNKVLVNWNYGLTLTPDNVIDKGMVIKNLFCSSVWIIIVYAI